MIKLSSRGDWSKTDLFLKRAYRLNIGALLRKYAEQGLKALSSATPVDTGLAASSWGYRIDEGKGQSTITWTNSDIEGGCSVVLLIQYGHGTKNGGYVQGRDFINPAMRPVFDNMVEELWKEVERL
ncbi:MAG: HK97 gp10 family phage protein [Clostridiales bacterium]|nr:HK97 gp10 family phage protein [Clostridiales bacterium]